MSSFFRELKRRNVIRVAVAYMVLAWVVLQITDLVAPALGLPDWTMTMVIFLGFVGFPFALLFSWIFELTPEGLKRSEDVERHDSITGKTASKLNQATTALLLVAVVLLVLDRQLGLSERWQVPAPEEPAPVSMDVSAETPPEANEADAASESPRSIAVLPFVNMSEDPSQEYFSDGISEELLNALAKIRELRVAARTSSFAFKGKNQDITEIGERLKVATVLEGSVRKSGQRVRITAQLINVEDGYHLWSESYDRDLVDIFAVQDEISAAIVDALKVHLTEGEAVAPTEQVDIRAYNFALQARHNVRARTKETLELAVKQFRQALDIDENYATAWAGMAIATSLLRDNQYGELSQEESYRLSQGYLDRAFALDPDLGLAYAGQALVHLDRSEPELGIAAADRALEQNPSEGVLYLWKSFMLDELGDYQASTRALEQAYLVDPLHPSIQLGWGARLAEIGRVEEAKNLLTPGTFVHYRLQREIAVTEGRWADIYRIMEEALRQGFDEGQQNVLRALQSLTLIYELYEPEPPWDFLWATSKKRADAIRDPEETIDRLQSIAPSQLSGNDHRALELALLQAGRCDAVLALLAPRELEQRPAYRHIPGPAVDDTDEIYASDLAWCLRQLGETDRAGQLAGKLLAPMLQALERGIPIYYLRARLPILHLAAGDDRAALDALRQLVDSGRFSFREFYEGPHFEPLAQDPEFIEIKADLLARVNRERASLGWAPVTDQGY